MKRCHNENEWREAMRLIERLSHPRGDWHDDEARRMARKFLKKWKPFETKSRLREDKQ